MADRRGAHSFAGCTEADGSGGTTQQTGGPRAARAPPSPRQVLEGVVKALTHPSAGVRIAACRCCQSLSRSVKNLRMALVRKPCLVRGEGWWAPCRAVQVELFRLVVG